MFIHFQPANLRRASVRWRRHFPLALDQQSGPGGQGQGELGEGKFRQVDNLATLGSGFVSANSNAGPVRAGHGVR